jgi:hypothetical protein
MERVRGRLAFAFYVGGVSLLFLAWLAEPSLRSEVTGGSVVAALYLLAALCCAVRLLSGPSRVGAAGWLALAVLMFAAKAPWLSLVASPPVLQWAELFLVQVVVGVLMIVPAFHWLHVAKASFPPPECALAVIAVIAQSVALAMFMPGEMLPAIGHLAETGLALVFCLWCCSIALAGGRFAIAEAGHAARPPAADQAEQHEILRQVIRLARAHHANRLQLRNRARRRGKTPRLVKAA